MFGPKSMTIFAVATAMSLMACSAAATPLYRLYQESLRLPQATVTIIFASYALAVLLSLLTLGSISDYVGRKPVILFALLLNAVALLVFLLAGSAGELIAARVIQGIAVGAATTTLGATILDTDKPHAPTLNGITNFAGLAVGALGSGLLVSFAPLPTKLIFLLLLAMTLVELALLFFMPETAQKRPGAARALVPRIILPKTVRGTFERVTPVNVAAWALGGFYLSLMPTLITNATGLKLPLIGALVVTGLMAAAAIAVLSLRQLQARTELMGGSVALIFGVATTLGSLYFHNVPGLFTGSIIAGGGFGAAFSGTLRSLLPLAGPTERAGLLSTFFIESYLAFSVPAIVAGAVSPLLGLPATTYWYGGVVIVLALVSLAAAIFASEPGAGAKVAERSRTH